MLFVFQTLFGIFIVCTMRACYINSIYLLKKFVKVICEDADFKRFCKIFCTLNIRVINAVYCAAAYKMRLYHKSGGNATCTYNADSDYRMPVLS